MKTDLFSSITCISGLSTDPSGGGKPINCTVRNDGLFYCYLISLEMGCYHSKPLSASLVVKEMYTPNTGDSFRYFVNPNRSFHTYLFPKRI
jgi:hypothetical protein